MRADSEKRRRSILRPGLVLPALTLAVAVAYLCLSNLPGQYDKDWVHLWTAGRMVVTGHGADLYNPELHHEILVDTYKGDVPAKVWPERNRRYGVFFYPPPAALYYAALAWLPRGTACGVNACLCVVLAFWNGFLLSKLTGERVSWALGTLAILAFPPFFSNYALGQNAMLSLSVVVTAWWLAGAPSLAKRWVGDQPPCETGRPSGIECPPPLLCKDGAPTLSLSVGVTAWWLAEGRRELAAGMLIGLFVCKPNWLLAVGWIPLVQGRWKMLAGVAVGGALTVLAAVAVMGTDPFVAYTKLFPRVADMHDLPGYVLKLKSSSLGLFRKWMGVGPTADLLGWGFAAVVGVITVMLVRGRWNLNGRARFSAAVARPLDGALPYGREGPLDGPLPHGRGSVRRGGNARGDSESELGRTAMACCLMAALWVNPHLNNYDLMLLAAGSVVIAADWGSLTRRWKCAAAALVLFCYTADPWDHSWTLNMALPLPNFAVLGMWTWFAARTWRLRRETSP